VLCKVLYKKVRRHVQDMHAIRFTKVGSSLVSTATMESSIGNVYALPGFVPTTPGVQLGTPLLAAPGSVAHTKILSEWIQTCNRHHPCVPKEESFLPKRVIDLGPAGHGPIRLFCTSHDQTPGRYLTLSHIWGPSMRFYTTRENLDSFTKEISSIYMPRTFQHAVEITRNLGIRYLWIDALCIVQDDREDWDYESKRMEHIFSSAYATLAATCAVNAGDGFLKQRPHRACVTLTRQERAGDMPYYFCEAIDDFSGDVDQSELSKRGWVLQERVLSKCTIHFAEKQTY